ncbi:hypothetical protein SELMODRAFT_233428 [Selaginella moellendorffii]|uniref:Uncharacterized protein n=1 Tax=Selaginella moellendorffii TaxID=88036 RepID=D8S8Y0_SELML|nr:hypothetical protein SELMODRAFT_233428 [Selaginella moellendorffii]
MARGILDLEKHFAFYGAYHSNRINVGIHVVFVWPILFTALLLMALASPKPLMPLPLPARTLPLQDFMVINYSFLFAGFYALFYTALDKRAGSLAAAMCLACWIGANAAAQKMGFSLGWKVAAGGQIFCWTAQFIGHGVFERRAPALLDNLVQALLMAPFFVLHDVFGYEPYPGFYKNVRNKVGAEIAKFRSGKSKKV